MILYSLIFIIIILYVYETFKDIKLYQNKIKNHKYDNDNLHENFDTNDYPQPEKNITGLRDIINNKNYPPLQQCSLDTTKFKSYAPLLYNQARKLYFNRKHLDDEAIRQNNITHKQLEKIQKLYDTESNQNIKKIYEAELALHKWKKYSFNKIDNNNTSRIDNDVITDYDYKVFGQQRVWDEVHFHTTKKND